MKIKQIQEALNFNNQAKAQIMKNAPNIMLGIEYEYDVNEEYHEEDDSDRFNNSMYQELESNITEQFADDYEQSREETISDAAREDMTNLGISSYIDNQYAYLYKFWKKHSDTLSQYKSGVAEADGDPGQILNTLRDVFSLVEPEKDLAFKLDSGDIRQDGGVDYLGGRVDDLDALKEHYHEFLDAMEVLSGVTTSTLTEENITEIDDAKEWFDDLFNDLSLSALNTPRRLEREALEALEEIAAESVPEWDDVHESYMDRISDAVDDAWYNLSSSERGDDSVVRVISDMLYKEDNEWGINYYTDIEAVKPEPSEPDVEVITKPLPMLRAFDVMGRMFQHIRDVGSTAEYTGMHVNMSIRGLPFTRENFDPIKLLVLLDEFFHRDGDEKKGIVKYPVRLNVERIFKKISARDFYIIADTYAKNGPKGLFSGLRNYVSLTNKFQSINFQHVWEGDVDFKGRHVELRYFGGEGYEERQEELEHDIMKAAFAMYAAFDKTFALKEYFNSIIRHLKRANPDLPNIGDVAVRIKNGVYSSAFDFIEDMDNGEKLRAIGNNLPKDIE